MPKTFWGILSGIILGVFIIQLFIFVTSILSNNPLGAIVTFIQIAPSTALLGISFGVKGLNKERGKKKVIPISTSIISVVYAGFTFFFLFGWSFGG
ncbi:hypothetical protein [Halobacillus trueperi]|uniref:Uncharacterized protein n=1 Tax=Halobacillus trueperi TaxID=156205 RepID=A0A3E0IYE8_9BACI|nr:hypothetical protein [Halobacillus trueperi]REJ05630.1 hypothetical protein DYE48_20310 [Halobacillus trueperi]